MKLPTARPSSFSIAITLLTLFIAGSPAQSEQPSEASPATDKVAVEKSEETKPEKSKKIRRVQGITFAESAGRFYLPVDQAARLLGWEVNHDEAGKTVTLKEQVIPYSELRQIIDGDFLVHMTHLIESGAVIKKSEDKRKVLVTYGNKEFLLIDAPQTVKVDLTTQRLKGWQGKRLVLDCHISSGKYGTPTGEYEAGPYKSRQHYSRLFNGASMPYSVQFYGHYFIHGFKTVPDYPASKGCIRMHLDQGNPAKFFYEWVKVGTPITVYKSEKKEA